MLSNTEMSKLDTSGIMGFGDANRVLTMQVSELIPWVQSRIRKAIAAAYSRDMEVYLINDEQVLDVDVPRISEDTVHEILNKHTGVLIIAITEKELEIKDIIHERGENYLLHVQLTKH